MRIVHNQLNDRPEPAPKKRVPMYKDKALIEETIRQLSIDNNERLRKIAAKKNQA